METERLDIEGETLNLPALPAASKPGEPETPETFRSGFVAIVGKPNVGKSTLLNAYLGQKIAIVSDKPQTTRVRQLGILTRPDAQVIFVDTPGIHKPLHLLGESMVEVATDCVADADVIVFLVDVGALPADDDVQIAAIIQEQGAGLPVVLALNKCDGVSADVVKSHIRAYWALISKEPLPLQPDTLEEFGTLGGIDWIVLSATTGHNREQLLDMIISRLPVGPAFYDQDTLTDLTERQIAADMIREQVLHHLHQEVPHAVAVVVEEWKERPNGTLYISATIFVEKDSQKGIVIGQGGKMLKAISMAARQEIEAMTDAPVFLELWVKVRKNWRKKDKDLQQLGYTVPRSRK